MVFKHLNCEVQRRTSGNLPIQKKNVTGHKKPYLFVSPSRCVLNAHA